MTEPKFMKTRTTAYDISLPGVGINFKRINDNPAFRVVVSSPTSACEFVLAIEDMQLLCQMLDDIRRQETKT